MRIPFPVHIPLWHAAWFSVALACIQIFQGTSPTFALFSFLFIILSTFTFNVAGGFSRTTGAYVFFFSVMVVILGLCWKAVLGEPADSNLLQPVLTMEIYVATMLAMLLAVVISKRLTRRRPLLGGLIDDSKMQDASIGCVVTGVSLVLVFALVDQGSGSALSALAQVNRFLPLAIILGVMYEIRRTGGRRSLNAPVVIAAAVTMFLGLVGYSKEYIFTPIACWLIAAASQGFRFSRAQVCSILLGLAFIVHYLVPYAQYGRNFRAETMWGGLGTSIDLLSDLEDTRQKYLQVVADNDEERNGGYFKKSQGLMDRLQMISVDDELHNETEERGAFGPVPLLLSFENLVPHFLWPGKPIINFGNFYAHQLGHLAADDVTTGISFSPAGEAYHLGKWFGIFVWAPVLWIMLFVVFDSLCGDMRSSPWGILVCAYYAHLAPEKMLGGVIYALGYLTFGVIFAAYSVAYLMPLLAALVKNPERARLRRGSPAGRRKDCHKRPTGAVTRREYTSHEVTAPRAVGPRGSASSCQSMPHGLSCWTSSAPLDACGSTIAG